MFFFGLKRQIFRLYYTRRSQPPMLTQIVWDYIKWTNDLTTEREFIAGIIWDLHEEFQYWESKMVEVMNEHGVNF